MLNRWYPLLFLLVLQSAFSVNAQVCDLANEQFEGSNPPTGWTQNGNYFGTLAPFSGSTHAGFNTLNDNLITAAYNCPGQVCFYWRASGASSNWDVDIEWSDDNGSTWNLAHTITTTGSGSPTAYAQLCVALPTGSYANPGNVRLRFNQSRRSGGSFYLDDVCVDAGVCSVAPTQFTFSDLTPGCIEAGKSFHLRACATDNMGNVDNTYSGEVTLSETSGGAALSGTTTITFSNGCGYWNDISLSAAGRFTLEADSGAITTATDSIDITGSCPTRDTLNVMMYNLLNFPDGRNDCGSNITITNRWDTLKRIVGYYRPDLLMVCELQNEYGADTVLNQCLNVNGTTTFKRANFVTNGSPGGTSLQQMLFYDSYKFTLFSQDEIRTDVRDINEYIIYMNDPNLNDQQDTTWLDLYVGHLKAGSGAGNEAQREEEIDSLIAHLNNRPAGRSVIFAGDFNLYSSSEQAWTKITTTGQYQLNDPVNRAGSWSNNSSFQDVHTQSTRNTGSTPVECGATGGMDDRFDFILASDSVMCSGAFDYIAGSYTAPGNSGSLFNDAINDAANSSEPDSILNALYFMSDHLPVKFQIDMMLPNLTLPVELVEFDAVHTGHEVELSWETLSERNSAWFAIERSGDGKAFSEIDRVVAAGTTNLPQRYNALDRNPLPGVSYYRLRQLDFDGSSKRSELVAVTAPATHPLQLLDLRQANGALRLRVESDPTAPLQLRIVNAIGQPVYSRQITGQSETAGIDLYPGLLPAGVYFLTIQNGAAQEVRRFTQTH